MTARSITALEDLLSQPEGSWTLADGALAIARIESPELNSETYLTRLTDMANVVRRRAGDARHPRFFAGALSRAVFDEFGLRCEPTLDDGSAEDVGSCLIDRVIDQRATACPTLMALLMIEVARLAGSRFEAISIPGRLLLRRDANSDPFLFDPLQGGRPVTQEECREIVANASAGQAEFREGYLRPITPTQLLARIVANLKATYWRASEYERAHDAVRLMLVIRPDDPREIRDLGRVLFLLKRYKRAIESFEVYLSHNPRGEDADVVRMLIEEARAGLGSASGQ